jgi:hypothetical protein
MDDELITVSNDAITIVAIKKLNCDEFFPTNNKYKFRAPINEFDIIYGKPGTIFSPWLPKHDLTALVNALCKSNSKYER